MGEKQTKLEILKTNLEEQKKEALDQIDSIIGDLSHDVKFNEKANAAELLKKYARDEIAKNEKEVLKLAQESAELDVQYFQKMHEEKLKSILSRMQLAIEMGNDSPEAFGRSFGLLKMGEEKDYLSIVDGINDGRIDENSEKWEKITAMMRSLGKLNLCDPREALSNTYKYAQFAALALLKPAKRVEVIRSILDDEKSHRIILTLVATNYLTIQQGKEMLEDAARQFPQRKDDFERTLLEIDGDAMVRYKDAVLKEQQDALKTYDRSFHQNYAGKFFSYKTLIGLEAGRYIGLATMAANFLANVSIKELFTDPVKFGKDFAGLLINPAFMAGAVVTGGSLELVTGGFGKGWVSQAFSNLTRDKSLEEEKKNDLKLKQMQTIIGNHYQICDIFYKYADQIKELKKDGKPITLTNLGINYDELSPEMRKFTEAKYNETLPQIADILADEEIGFGLETPGLQRTFLENACEELGVSKFKPLVETA